MALPSPVMFNSSDTIPKSPVLWVPSRRTIFPLAASSRAFVIVATGASRVPGFESSPPGETNIVPASGLNGNNISA